MIAEEITDYLDSIENEFLKFKRIDKTEKLSTRPDLAAFILLEGLFPDDGGIISSADYDQIFLSVEWEDIQTITKAQWLYLHRCGVRFDSDTESLCMFV